MRPRLGRMPTMAQCPDGPLTELPVSVPNPASPRLAANPAAAASSDTQAHTAGRSDSCCCWTAIVSLSIIAQLMLAKMVKGASGRHTPSLTAAERKLHTAVVI